MSEFNLEILRLQNKEILQSVTVYDLLFLAFPLLKNLITLFFKRGVRAGTIRKYILALIFVCVCHFPLSRILSALLFVIQKIFSPYF